MNVHSIGPFILGKTLGTGSTGKVKLAFHKDTGLKVAIKIISKEFLIQRPTMLRKVEREIAVMKLVDNLHVLRLYDVYETTKYLFLVLEHVEGGELFDYLVSRGTLEISEARIFFQQIIAGIDYCHNHLICHRDLKPENLLLDTDRNIKICDFGMASLMKKGELLSTSCGSPHYASPEVVMGIKYDGFAADVWSCGVILFALLTGKLPFDDENIRTLLAKVKTGVFTMPPYLSAEAQDLISKMLTLDPKKRITIRQIREHPWFIANHLNVPITPPIVDVSITNQVSDIDEEIVRSLVCLGWTQESDLMKALGSSHPNIEKTFYWLLDERKNNPSFNPVSGTVNVTPGQHPGRRVSASDHSSDDRIDSEENRGRSNSLLSPGNSNPQMRRVTSTGNKSQLINPGGTGSSPSTPTVPSEKSPLSSPRNPSSKKVPLVPTSTFVHIKLDTNEEAQRSWFSSFLGGSRKNTSNQNHGSLFSSSSSITNPEVKREVSETSGNNLNGSMGSSESSSTENKQKEKDEIVAPKKDDSKKFQSRAKALLKDNFYSTKTVTGGAFGLHSRKPPDQVITELKRTLSALQVTYRYIKKGNCIKAKCVEGNNKVKFVIEVTLLQEGNDIVSSFISFVRTQGDLPSYRVVCKKIEDEIVLK